MKTASLACTIILSGSLVVSAALLSPRVTAGPLDPPAGPVAPTYKTLQEVFDKAGAAEPRIAISTATTPGDADSLYKITQRGSYYLTGSITGAIGKHGIEIAASGVTLDLNGFDLLGFASLGGVMVTASNQNNIAVVNGSVRNWGEGGVNLGAATNCRVEGVLASGNAGDGINAGAGAAVTNCSASSNPGNGISIGVGSTITNCAASLNGGHGFVGSDGAILRSCTAAGNDGRGFVLNNGGHISGCNSRANLQGGIQVSSRCIVENNNSSDDGSAPSIQGGISVLGQGNRIEGNNVNAADRGLVVVTGGNLIVRNSIRFSGINYDIASGNDAGPIGSASTATSPWANIQY